MNSELIFKKCAAVSGSCQIELENLFDYKQGYWVSKNTDQLLQGIAWTRGYPNLRTSLVIQGHIDPFELGGEEFIEFSTIQTTSFNENQTAQNYTGYFWCQGDDHTYKDLHGRQKLTIANESRVLFLI